jgi:hypothetical protein
VHAFGHIGGRVTRRGRRAQAAGLLVTVVRSASSTQYTPTGHTATRRWHVLIHYFAKWVPVSNHSPLNGSQQ